MQARIVLLKKLGLEQDVASIDIASSEEFLQTFRATLAARFPGGIPAFSLGCLPRANLHRAKFLRTLAAHPSEGRSPLPFFFHAEGIHDS